MTQAERSAHHQRMQAIAQQREADKAQRQHDAATAAAQRWEAALPAPARGRRVALDRAPLCLADVAAPSMRHADSDQQTTDRRTPSPPRTRVSSREVATRSGALRRPVARTQRRSDGTFTLDAVRYEIPSRFRTLRELTVRYARWDLSLVELYDPRTGLAQCRVFPINKVANADGHRRRVDPSPAHLAVPPDGADAGIAPYLRELIGRYAATGLLPGYLPTPHAHDPTEPTS